ncbi:hypothetical protein RFI_16831 [Reticulomyxa filosa]|uniref:Transmembrane protein n=1 Tax=Reticulomyxa filosa TaxID=46433 RepID=X6N3F3_RETFI|nr:hypothetical protein RFI_16831 [Reticulomyxa filosa]|eukprot:ETO20388.1 hypothetical protein RFI_16831 [Reticulomyxa filosa]
MLILYNVSYTVALYGLFYFYVACKGIISKHSPVKKFLAVKAVIFMTYWQSLFVPLLFGSEYADKWNDAILCVEMMIFAHLHYKAFPWYEFRYEETNFERTIDAVGTQEYATISYLRSWHEKEEEDSSSGGHGSDPHPPVAASVTVTEDKNTRLTTSESVTTSKPLDTKTASEKDAVSVQTKELKDTIASEYCSYGDIRRSDVNNKASYCTALWQVVNVLDIFSDAYHSFKPNQNHLQQHLHRLKQQTMDKINRKKLFQLEDCNSVNQPDHQLPLMVDNYDKQLNHDFATVTDDLTAILAMDQPSDIEVTSIRNDFVPPNFQFDEHEHEHEQMAPPLPATAATSGSLLNVLANKTKHMDLRTSDITFDSVKSLKSQSIENARDKEEHLNQS